MGPYDVTAKLTTGGDQALAAYRGKFLLIVNVASQRGFTQQYKGLQSLHEQYAPRGFAVLAFLCDQFGHQEPGSDADIAAFCDRRFRVTFPVFAKIEMNGPRAPAVFLAEAAEGRAARQRHQVEFYEVPRGPGWWRPRPLCITDNAGRPFG